MADHIIDFINPQPGIQRDGTQFDCPNCIDGQWVRFYKGRPQKIGGRVLIDPGTTEIIRNIYEVDRQGNVDVYLGRPSSLNVITVVNDAGSPEINRTPANFVADTNNTWTFDLWTETAVTATVNLGNGPLAVTMGSATVVVTVPSTQYLKTEQFVTIAGAADAGGILAVNLNITASIIVLTLTTFSYVANAAGTGNEPAGGGNAVTYSTTGPVSYLMAHAAPNLLSINNSTEGLIYGGDITTTGVLTEISTSHQKCSGGIVSLYPYFFKYGNDGVLSWTLHPFGDWADAKTAAITGTKIINGIRTRGGSGSPSGLFWSTNSLIRATFIGGDPQFQFDVVQDKVYLMSENCVVTVPETNITYFIGIDQFYQYTGILRPLPNNMSRDYFFDNVDLTYRNKIFGIYKPKKHEIWWSYPVKGSVENSNVIIYNIESETWYDSIHARSAGFEPGFLPYPIETDSTTLLNRLNPTLTVTVPLGVDPLSTVNGFATVRVTVPSTASLRNGNLVTIAGATETGGILPINLNVSSPIVIISPTVFSYTSTGMATSTDTDGGNAVTYSYNVPNNCYGVWQEETGVDQVAFNQVTAIDSYFETNIITFFEKFPADDRQLRIRRIEPDFNQAEPMTMIINTRDFAQSIVTSSQPYTFLPGQEVVELAKIDTTNMGRLVSFRFQSNTLNGYYLMGKVVLNYAPGDVRP